MGKKKDTFLNMTLSLIGITLVAGLSLGYVNDLTVGPKAKAKLEKKLNALKLVLPEFDNSPVEDIQMVKSSVVKDSVEIYPAFQKNSFVGAAVIGSTEKGFSGLIKIMVGFAANGDMLTIEVLEQKETPGLGTKIKNDSFIDQFRGKNPGTYNLKVKKDGGDVDALTGATITSRAFGEAAQMAYEEFEKNKESLKSLKN